MYHNSKNTADENARRLQEVSEIVSNVIMKEDVLFQVTTVLRNYIYANWMLEDDQIRTWLQEDYLVPGIRRVILENAGDNQNKLRVFVHPVKQAILKICGSLLHKKHSDQFVEEMLAYGIQKRIWTQEQVLKIKYQALTTNSLEAFKPILPRFPDKYFRLLDNLNKRRLEFIATHFGPKARIEAWSIHDTEILLGNIQRRGIFYFVIPFLVLAILLYNFLSYLAFTSNVIDFGFSILVAWELASMFQVRVSNVVQNYTFLDVRDNNNETQIRDLPRVALERALLLSLASLQAIKEAVVVSVEQVKPKRNQLASPGLASDISYSYFEPIGPMNSNLKAEYRRQLSSRFKTELTRVEDTIVHAKTVDVETIQWPFTNSNEKTEIFSFPSIGKEYEIFQLWTLNPSQKDYNDISYLLWIEQDVIDLLDKLKKGNFYDPVYRVAKIGHIADAKGEAGFKKTSDGYKLKLLRTAIGAGTGKFRLFCTELCRVRALDGRDKMLYSPTRFTKVH